MHRVLKGFLPVFALFTLISSVAADPFRSSGPVLYVNEVPVLRIKAPAGGLTPDMRAALAASALGGLGSLGPVTMKKVGADALIYVGNTLCLTVTTADASKYKMPTLSLAGMWVKRLRDALDLPPLKLSSDSLDIPVGAVREVRLVGSKAAASTFEVSASNVAFVRRSGDGFQVRALGPGVGTVKVRADAETVTLNVVVRPLAATFPQTVDAEVTGIPAMGTTVQGALASTLKTQLQGVPGARFSYTLPQTTRLATGKTQTYTVRVRAEGSGAIASNGLVKVRVKNVPLPRRQDAELWYSNNPEVVKRSMPLFSATLRPDVPARLLYHHVNASTQPMYIRVQAVNQSDSPARVVVIPGDSRPDPNPVRAGMVAADQYFRAWVIGSGEVVTIPPHSTLPISLRRLSPGDTASGLCGLRLMPDSPELLVRTDSWPPFNLDPAWRTAVESSTPWREVGCPAINDFDRAPYEISEHVYPNPHKSEEMKYEVGGRYGYIRIGQRAISRQDSNSRLDGNFGVIYNIKASMENPTQQATDVEVVFEASAGYSGGLFMLNGNLLKTPLLQPKGESQLARFHLDPGASRHFDITTIPLSGSSYPATITIRPILNVAERPMRTVKK